MREKSHLSHLVDWSMRQFDRGVTPPDGLMGFMDAILTGISWDR